MIISRTPYRVSFFGGGTDYPAWYMEHGGAVLGAAIDKYCYLTCRYLPPFFEHRIRVVYSKIEHCSSLDEIQHPAVREVLRYMEFDRAVEIHHDGDLPARSGMGSSSAFTVGLLHALHSLQGRMISKQQLAMEGIHLEQNLLKENVGSQDQVMAAYGGLNHVQFSCGGEISVRPVILPATRLNEFNDHLMLFYTGIIRTASQVAASFVNDFESRKRTLRIMQDLVNECLELLCSNRDISHVGKLLHETWQLKRSLSGAISNTEVDDIYNLARKQGAIGGKLLGAGGGGFMLLFVPPERQVAVREALGSLLHVPFSFENNGSQIIFYDVEEDYAKQDVARSSQSLTAFRELKLEGDGEAVGT